MDLLNHLQTGLRALGEDPHAHPCDSYLAYIELLAKWNKAYSLSGIRQKTQMLTHHVLDSLSILPYLHGDSGLDVGSGAGLPGFLLALARPDMHWVLLDSNQKKTRFLNQAKLELGPLNIEVVGMRLEDYRPQTLFTSIVCRALMSAADFTQQTLDLLDAQGRIILMKGRAPKDEMLALDTQILDVVCKSINVPDVDAERHVLLIERKH